MKWKYLVVPTLISENTSEDNKPLYQEGGFLDLDKIGSIGWELASVDGGVAYFKMPSPEWVEEQNELLNKHISRTIKGVLI